MSTDPGYVLPNPSIPKTLGILNIVFAVILILLGTCTLGFTLIMPMFANYAQTSIKENQAKIQKIAEERKATQTKELDDREKAATTDEEKAAVEKERAEIAAAPAPEPIPDLSAMTDVVKDPTILGYTIANIGTGLILHIVMLISGIGLIRLTPWGRKLALWWAGLQIVQVIIMQVINILVVMPITMQAQQQMIQKMNANGANPMMQQQADMTQVMSGMSTVFAVGYIILGCTYPVICLLLLNAKSARAACLGGKSGTPVGPGVI